MKRTGFIAALMVIGLLAGCGQTVENGIGQNQTSNEIQNSSSTNGNQAKGTDVKQGIQTMLTLTATMDTAIQGSDASKAATTGSSLEDAWSRFEDQVHASHADDYANVEKYLDPLEAASKASPLDKTVIAQLNSELRQALQTLQSHLGA